MDVTSLFSGTSFLAAAAAAPARLDTATVTAAIRAAVVAGFRPGGGRARSAAMVAGRLEAAFSGWPDAGRYEFAVPRRGFYG